MVKTPEGKKILLIFLTAILVYGIVVSFFTSTVHVNVDEELYLSLARSFHYNGKFEYENQIMDYNCVLYSMLISSAYYFYSPERILFLMRMIGVVSMTSTIFPVYLLAKDYLNDSKKAMSVSAFLMIMPYMFDCAYIMQEVLAYPLFMWTVYFLYSAYTKEDKKINFLLGGAVLSILSMFTKTYMFFVPIVVNICAFVEVAKDKNRSKNVVFSTVIYDVVCVVFFIGMYYMIFAINGYEKGTNHYESQFALLFPIGVNTIVWGIIGCVVYAAFFIVNVGVFPVGVLFKQWSNVKNRSWLYLFLMVSVPMLIIEIVFMIVLTEQGIGKLPNKFSFRYFHIFVPIVFIIFEKFRGDVSFLKSFKIKTLMIASLCVAIVYFASMKGNTVQAIIDGHFFLFLENLTKYIVPGADVLIMMFFLIFLIIVISMYPKIENNTKVITRFIHIIVIGIGLFWLVELVQLPYYTNIIADGTHIQEDSVQIAQFLNREEYDILYYVYASTEERNSYMRNFYGYIIQPYQVISKEKMNEILERQENNTKEAFLFPADMLVENDKLEKVPLGTQRLILCIP